MNGLLRDLTFRIVEESKIPDNPRMFGSRFAEELKKVGERFQRKSR